jgi:hypothetical protein
MKYQWLFEKLLRRSYGNVQPHGIKMGSEAWQEYLDMIDESDAPDKELCIFRFKGCLVEEDKNLSVRELLFYFSDTLPPKEKQPMRTPAVRPKPHRPRWTQEEMLDLEILYSDNNNAAIAKRMRKPVSSIIFKAHRMGLKKSAERLKAMGEENVKNRWSKKRKG